MAGDVHHLTAAAGQLPNAAAVLRTAGEVWAATDLDGIEAATRKWLGMLIPGTQVRRCLRNDGLVASANRQRQIRLSEHEVLVISTSNSDIDEELLQAAVERIESRIDVLGRQTALAESFEQLGRAEKLQRALYAIADQASAAGADINAMFGKISTAYCERCSWSMSCSWTKSKGIRASTNAA